MKLPHAGVLEWARLHVDAVPPSKAHPQDSGFDVTLLGVKEGTENRRAPLYRTGIAVSPPHGWYVDLVPRSSISKTGYRVANGFGVIDATYRGELYVALEKVDPEAPELEFPVKLVQMILRPLVDASVAEVESLNSTERGAGGFGSTG